MRPMQDTLLNHIDSPDMRQAGGDLLSLALMDARNHTLHLAGQIDSALAANSVAVPVLAELNPPLWTLGHVGWFQEWWVTRNLHRQRGRLAEPDAMRLASILPQADHWFNPLMNSHDSRWAMALPDVGAIKSYLLDTLETSLELLEKTPDDDAALYFFRLALFHEDQRGEELITLAQTMGLPLELSLPGPQAPREPILLPTTRWSLGSSTQAGFTFDNESPAFDVQVPEFEIDAQAVSWAQFVEFVDDGGYDEPRFWYADGWRWLQEKSAAEGRRGPRYVDQIGVASGAVMQTRFGKAMRMLGNQAATHLTWWEADAWCRWAGRRLPAEVEWEVAAHNAVRRGFRWGDVWEWTGTTFNGYPGFVPGPWRDYSEPHFATGKVLRGASFATRARMKSPKFRAFAMPHQDELFCGFRSCAF
jgi:gamma-glutamyl hercynylcysteine S-oxide synthase